MISCNRLVHNPFAPQRFQDIEEAHLKQMKEFIMMYIDIVQGNHDLVGQVRLSSMGVGRFILQCLVRRFTRTSSVNF